MSRSPLRSDDLDRLELSGAGTPEESLALARQYERFAKDPHPSDEMSVASLLVLAGERYSMADDAEMALALFRRAVADGGSVAPDARCYLVAGLIDCELRDEAAAVADGLLREHPSDADVYQFVGEVYELDGDLETAARWFTAGVLMALRDDAVPASAAVALVAARWRVRREMGFTPDDYDDIALAAVDDV